MVNENLLYDIEEYIYFKLQLQELDGCILREDNCTYDSAQNEQIMSLLNSEGETFSQMLLRLIDKKHMLDTEVYKGAHVDRRLFSKIRNNKDYTPNKSTILAIAISMKLSIEETSDLLRTAGYALSDSNKRDIIVQYFLNHGDYDIFRINEALFYFNQRILFS